MPNNAQKGSVRKPWNDLRELEILSTESVKWATAACPKDPSVLKILRR